MKQDFIKKIYDLAVESFENDEIPVGAVVVKDNKIIGVGINNREYDKSVVGHAEINAINEACKYIGDWRLDGCDIYVTLLPCMMCAGAILESRIDRVFYLCDRTNVRFNSSEYINTIKINDDLYGEKYLNLLQLFFENKRN